MNWSNLIDSESNIIVSMSVDNILKDSGFEYKNILEENCVTAIKDKNLSYKFYNNEYDKFGYITIFNDYAIISNLEYYNDEKMLLAVGKLSYCDDERYSIEKFEKFLNRLVKVYIEKMDYLIGSQFYESVIESSYNKNK